jgi:hypothetical protein
MFSYLFDSELKIGCFVVKLSAYVDVSSPGAHGPSCDEAAFKKFVRVVTHDLAVLASSRFTLTKKEENLFKLITFKLVFESISKKFRN